MVILVLAILAIIFMPQIVAFCIAFRDAYIAARDAARSARASSDDSDDA